MIARLGVATPFLMLVPEGAEFKVYGYMDSGYEVRIYPPMRSNLPLTGDVPERSEINGKPAFVANALQFDFIKDNYDRTIGAPDDPPLEVMERALGSFLRRYRYVARSWQVTPSGFPRTTWRLEYLNDDGTPFEQEAGKFRARLGRERRVSLVALTPEMFDQIATLDTEWQPLGGTTCS